jgi:uncharacterized protein YecT (DUF1311 family)
VEPDRRSDVRSSVRTPNWTTIALVGGLVVLVLLIAYFATSRNEDQDKLTANQLAQTEQQPKASAPEKLCDRKQTLDLIKRELFRGAAGVRGSDQAAFDQLAGYAVVRMENPVMESESDATGAVNCSGSLSLDLPPGVAVAGGRRTLSADVDYTVQQAADGSAPAVQLRNAEAIVTSLATLTRVNEPAQPPVTEPSVETNAQVPEANAAASESANKEVGPKTAYRGRPSFDCSAARSKGEIAVCGDSGLAALDVNMATQYRAAIAAASPAQKELLQRTRGHFLAYRDRCPSRSCIADAYVGRMREIRDIMEGRWRPSR